MAFAQNYQSRVAVAPSEIEIVRSPPSFGSLGKKLLHGREVEFVLGEIDNAPALAEEVHPE